MQTLLASVLLLAKTCFAQQAERPQLPDDVVKRAVTIWSDGTRMAGDLYLPKDLKSTDKLPAVLFCSGTGGTKEGPPTRLAPSFVQRGFIFLAFDYRGWGASDGRLMALEPLPKPDAEGNVTVRAKVIRWQLDFADQSLDIRNAISFLAGEPNVDAARIGLLGTSYGGGLVTWAAATDPRVKCVAVQVPGMGGGRPAAALQNAYKLSTQQARGEIEPVPIETGKLGGKMAAYENMRSNPAKGIGFNVVEAASRITAPMIILDAEKEELLDVRQNGQRVYEILKAKETAPVAYHVMPGISHYGIYREAAAEATKLELDWFAKYLQQPQ